MIPITPGVLARDQLEGLIRDGHVSSDGPKPPEVGGAAVDLRLGSKAWKLKNGQRPTTRELSKIQANAEPMSPDAGYFEFEKRSIYLVKLDQQLSLPSNISGRATGKSSVGRLDVITRLITRGNKEYDLVTAGYDGELHLLVAPQTFTIRVKPGSSLNQLRFFSGSHTSSALTREDLSHYGTEFWWTLKHGASSYDGWVIPSTTPTDDPLLLDLTVDLADPKYPYVFRAKRDVTTAIDLGLKAGLDPKEFFERVNVEADLPDRFVVLERDSFYIMKSRERLFLPLDVAVEVVAISERIGDIRIHYAGFAHPGFGRSDRPDTARKGTPLIFEVRATDMDTKLYDGSVLARIQMFRMSKETTPDKSDYEEQELKLSKVFDDWGG